MPVTFGTSVPTRGPLAGPDELRALAQRADDLGFDHIWVSDHVILPREVSSFYPYAADGVATFRPDEPYFEPLAALNFLAGCTQRVRAGHPRAHPPLPQPRAHRQDPGHPGRALSGGRVILGAGVGWMEEEFEALGLDTYARRGAGHRRVHPELTRSSGPPTTPSSTASSTRHQRQPASCPSPCRNPHPPIWIGGHTNPAIRRAATLGDGWMPIGLRPPAILEPEELSGLIARLRRLTVQAGRDEKAVDLTFSTDVRFNNAADGSTAPG